MKPIKLLFSISLLVFTSNVKSQNAFIDSSTYYTFGSTSSLANFYEYIKESVQYDSTNTDGEFYSVSHYASKYNLFTKYTLRAQNDKVYFTGKLYTFQRIDSFDVADLMIYDCSLKIGDTMVIAHTASNLYIKLLVDSIRDNYYFDGKPRQTHYYSFLVRGNESDYAYMFATKGLGSNCGLVPFRINHRNAPYSKRLISICNATNTNVYTKTEFDYWELKSFCDETEIIEKVKEIDKSSIENKPYPSIKVFPNPVKNELFINGNGSMSNYKIYNSTGQIMDFGQLDESVKTMNLPSGFYSIVIEQQSKVFYGKFIKE